VRVVTEGVASPPSTPTNAAAGRPDREDARAAPDGESDGGDFDCGESDCGESGGDDSDCGDFDGDDSGGDDSDCGDFDGDDYDGGSSVRTSSYS
jgi:hypothetical protein